MQNYMLLINNNLQSLELQNCDMDEIIILCANSTEDLNKQVAEHISQRDDFSINYYVIELTENNLKYIEDFSDYSVYGELLYTLLIKTQQQLNCVLERIEMFNTEY
nr:MAG TPA: hypothetical protein [Caudoviricetes sp.]